MTRTISTERNNLLSIQPAAAVVVRELQADQEGDWNQFVATSPMGTFFHQTGWMNVVEDVLGHRCTKLVAWRGDAISGVFPISCIRNKIFGDCLVSLPLAVYGGICADDDESYFSLLNAGGDLANRLHVKYLEMRNRTKPFGTGLPERDLYVTFTQDLSCGPDRLLQGLPRDTRYIVRKSLKAALSFTEDLSVEEFYELYAGSVHRLGTPVFSRKLFLKLRAEFPNQCRLFGVRKGLKAIAGVFCLYFKDQVMPYYAGSLPEYNRDSPNNFMYWSLMLQSCAEGIQHFDFGRSKRGTGAFNFKSTWSMTMSALPYMFQLVSAKEVPHLSPVDPKFHLPVAVWKRMPFPWTKIVGPRLIPWIPSV
jgi:FemAB-related protein (PEP-CTERM system-associated)